MPPLDVADHTDSVGQGRLTSRVAMQWRIVITAGQARTSPSSAAPSMTMELAGEISNSGTQADLVRLFSLHEDDARLDAPGDSGHRLFRERP
jgi:hypothetical protein